ncbi:MAG TPA: helix-turn-helix transcriptional regulator [Streptomyces sp.]|uniref:helix-turn-helix domain-containing protein n=1 Tax=Streptomyces sp. TaxID=1931 RepID=UPI002D54CFD0|nr:helix-turn-helix transcriptional regulator [Streptomyces sp.]HZG06582.1 helix-turn-helix transcriptional regulator [Streptomyces sp.]
MAKETGIGGVNQPRLGWEFFGSELKRCREAAGLTQQELGERVYVSGAYIGQFEVAVRKPQLDVAQRIDVELKTGGFFERFCREMIDRSPYAKYFTEVVDMELSATSIYEYDPLFVPGLLQTAAYARAVFLAHQPLAPEKEIEEHIQARLARAKLLHRPKKPFFWAVLDESVLRRPVGGPAVMAELLHHIAEMIKGRRAVIQVLPFSAGAPALSSMTALMTFTDAPPVAYVEGTATGNLLDDPATVAQCQLSYDLLRAAALSPEASLSLIESVAEDYANEHRA